jgi:hypothetical protein
MGYGKTTGELRWPGGRIPYEIDQLSFPPGSAARAAIDNAITMWNNAAALVTLTPHAGEPDFVQFIPDQFNTRSDIGRVGGKQNILCAFFPPVNGGAPIAAANQGSDQVDVFYIDQAGGVRVSWVGGNADWDGPAALTGPNTAPSGGAVTTGQQGDGDQLDLFFVDNTGAVNVMWVGESGPWQRATITGAGSAPAGANLCTGRQGGNQLDLFWVDAAGAVNVMWVGATGPWQRATISGPGSAPAGAFLCTGHQGDGDQLDLFWVDGNGAVNVMWVGATGPWKHDKLTGNGAAQPGAPLCTGRQGSDQLDLFWVDAAGAVNVMWVGATGPWQRATIAGAGSAPAGAFLCTGHQGDGDQLDLFWVDAAGAVNVMWVGATGPWKRNTLAGVSAHPGGALATARQSGSQLDLFFVDDVQSLNVMWVGATGAWNGPAQFKVARFLPGSVAHETGHAIGLLHEHQRPDSATFVTIVGGGPPDYGPVASSTTIGAYDYDSIMHYPKKTNRPTLSVNPPGPPPGISVGQRTHLSTGDVASARYLYGQIAAAGAVLAADRQGGNQLDVFLVDVFGAITVLWVGGVGVWQGPAELTGAGVAVPAGTSIATGRQGDGSQLDVFFVDTTGAVNVMWVGATGPWQRAAITGPGSAPPGASLCTGRQGTEQLDVFWVDSNGAVNVMWVGATGPWQRAAITGPGAAPAGAYLCTGNQGDGDQLDLFWVDGNGAVNVMWVGASGSWKHDTLTGPGAAKPGGALCTGHQGDGDQLDLFWVDGNGAVNVMWVGASGSWKHDTLTGPGAGPAGAILATARQGADQLDLFWVDTNGAVNIMWVGATGAWKHDKLTSDNAAPPGGSVCAGAQGDDQLDFFWVGTNGGPVNVRWVGSDGQWRGPSVALGSSVQALQPMPAPLSPRDTLTALQNLDISTSIEPVSDLLDWLGDPANTPYPALAQALLTLLSGRRLKAQVFIDVIRGFYEENLGQPSPRAVTDVHIDALQTAVVLAYNENNGTDFTKFSDLLA